MSYSKVYSRINWQNEPSTNTPINETNLNAMDYALNEVDNRIITIDISKANQSDLLQSLKSLHYDTTTGVFVFTYWNGTTETVDLNIEKIPVSFSMDANGIITMTTSDGSTYTADVGSLIKTYTFVDSTDIDFTTTTDASGNKAVSAEIVDGSVTARKLQPNYLADIQTEVANAQGYANSASTSATNASNQALEAEAWADGQKNGVDVPSTAEQYHNNAKYWAEQAQQAGSSGHTIVDENGTSYAQEPNLQFVGAKVSDDSTNNKTVVTVWEHKTKAQWEAMTPQEQADGNFIVSGLGTTGDLKNNYVSFTSGDSADVDATSWISVQPMANTDIFSTLFNKISTMAKNVRWLKNRNELVQYETTSKDLNSTLKWLWDNIFNNSNLSSEDKYDAMNRIIVNDSWGYWYKCHYYTSVSLCFSTVFAIDATRFYLSALCYTPSSNTSIAYLQTTAPSGVTASQITGRTYTITLPKKFLP